MFYDYRFAPVLILLVVGVVALFQGSLVLKTGTAEIPIGRGRRLDGSAARTLGGVYVVIGAICLLTLLLALLG